MPTVLWLCLYLSIFSSPMDNFNNKIYCRKYIRAKRRNLSASARQHKEQHIRNNILNMLQSYYPLACNIGLYSPLGSEVSIIELSHVAQKSYQFFLPRIIRDEMYFLPFTSMEDCNHDDMGILAPKTHEEAVFPDIILTPLVAFSESGARLGQGGGFFDRYIHHCKEHNIKTIFIGVAFELQKLPHIPTEPHDALLDAIITENQFYQHKGYDN